MNEENNAAEDEEELEDGSFTGVLHHFLEYLRSVKDHAAAQKTAQLIEKSLDTKKLSVESHAMVVLLYNIYSVSHSFDDPSGNTGITTLLQRYLECKGCFQI